MGALFEPAFDYLMSWEDPSRLGKVTVDSGGVTKWGISQRAYPHLDIHNLTLENAAEIYRHDYFTPLHGFDLTSQQVASKLLDLGVNMGVGTGIRLLQKALSLSVDGLFGPQTLASANGTDPKTLLPTLVEAAKAHYQEIVSAKPSLSIYLTGWLRRAEALPPT